MDTAISIGPNVRRAGALPYVALLLIVMAAFAAFFAAGHAASGGEALLMPLDDTYIHFQYARMIAIGQPFRYYPGDPYSSGATSLIYPFLLAVGYKLGFVGVSLGLWAVGFGLIGWIAATWLVYRLIGGSVGFGVAAAFTLSGGLAFAFMSGMETGLMIFATLLTLYAAIRGRLPLLILAATLAAVTRPEGLIIAGGALVYDIWQRRRWRAWVWIALPLGAGLAQSAMNLLLTGSATASGMQSKSYLYNVPFEVGKEIHDYVTNFATLWRELFTGTHVDGVTYIAPLVGVGALLYLMWRLWRARRPAFRRQEGPGLGQVLLVAFWLLGLSGAISILETAFWQFKRYQQPIFALLFVLFGWGLAYLGRRPTRLKQALTVAALAVTLGVASVTCASFVGYYADNIHEVASFQFPMARYVAANTPVGTRIGVHDAGVMAYLGDRPIYDVPGLSTPGAALAWRGGPGSMYEALRSSPLRPDWFAIYPDHHGLAYFAPTDLFKDVRARFESTGIARNVASATPEQWVTHADWARIIAADARPPAFVAAATQGGGVNADLSPVDTLNVADLADETAHQYQWTMSAPLPGFATELYQQAYRAAPDVAIADGGRLLTGAESFTIRTIPGRDLLWITRVHPRAAAAVTLMINGAAVAARYQPGGEGGAWLDIVSVVPGRLITTDRTRLGVQVRSGVYMPYRHWFYSYGAGGYQPAPTPDLPHVAAPFDGPPGAPGRVWLRGVRVTVTPAVLGNPGQLSVEVAWEADSANPPTGDAKVFVHLYKGPDQPPVAQFDGRPGGGALPPANWLPGSLTETYTVRLPYEAGTYQVALGLYDPGTGLRYTMQTVPSSTGTNPAAPPDRLFLAPVVVR